jgi:hypothetical protein
MSSVERSVEMPRADQADDVKAEQLVCIARRLTCCGVNTRKLCAGTNTMTGNAF